MLKIQFGTSSPAFPVISTVPVRRSGTTCITHSKGNLFVCNLSSLPNSTYLPVAIKDKLEDSKGVLRGSKLKDKQYNVENKNEQTVIY